MHNRIDSGLNEELNQMTRMYLDNLYKNSMRKQIEEEAKLLEVERELNEIKEREAFQSYYEEKGRLS